MSISRRDFLCAATSFGLNTASSAHGQNPVACPEGTTYIDNPTPQHDLPPTTSLPIAIRAKLLTLISRLTGFTEAELTDSKVIPRNIRDANALNETRLDTIKALAPLGFDVFSVQDPPSPPPPAIMLMKDSGASAGKALGQATRAVGIITPDYARELGITPTTNAMFIAVSYHDLLRIVREFSGDDLFTATIGGGSRDLYKRLHAFIGTARLALTVAIADDMVNATSFDISRSNIVSHSPHGCITNTAARLLQKPTDFATADAQTTIISCIDNILQLLPQDTPSTRPRTRAAKPVTAASPK